MTLCHSRNNHLCDSFRQGPKWHGLSPFGRQVVAEMNRLGMMIDVSHVSDDTFYQVIELSKAPVVATHSSCRHFTPGWHRNMSDEMICDLASKGGVIQINFGSIFLNATTNREFVTLREEIASTSRPTICKVMRRTTTPSSDSSKPNLASAHLAGRRAYRPRRQARRHRPSAWAPTSTASSRCRRPGGRLRLP
jgi:microsomal dipeptidase-like Zn-dependent dipeptidase